MISLNINGKTVKLDVDSDTPLLWALRDHAGLPGTKFGCGIGVCGACTVLLDGNVMRSCVLRVGDVGNMTVTTIEGLSSDSSHPVQQAWIAENVPQCGYCQSGQILAAVALLKNNPKPTDADIDSAMTNICRCGTYNRMRAAIHRVAKGGTT